MGSYACVSKNVAGIHLYYISLPHHNTREQRFFLNERHEILLKCLTQQITNWS